MITIRHGRITASIEALNSDNLRLTLEIDKATHEITCRIDGIIEALSAIGLSKQTVNALNAKILKTLAKRRPL